jgi:hypothetical protein
MRHHRSAQTFAIRRLSPSVARRAAGERRLSDRSFPQSWFEFRHLPAQVLGKVFQGPDLLGNGIADSATKTVGNLRILFSCLLTQCELRRYGGAIYHAQAKGEERKLTQTLVGKICPFGGRDPGWPALVGRPC